MQFVLLTFVIGVLNLCLGYALAVHLGYGPPTLWDAWEALGGPRPTADISSDQITATEDVIQGPEQAWVPSPEKSLPAEPEEDSDPVVEPELSDLDALRRFVDKAIASLSDFTARLKKSDGGQAGRTSWNFVADLQQICEPYLRHLSEAADRLCDSGEATALSDEVQQTILEQVAQLETTLSNLQYMDFDSGVSTAMTRLSADTENTLSLARSLQKALEAEPETAGDEDAESAAD